MAHQCVLQRHIITGILHPNSDKVQHVADTSLGQETMGRCRAHSYSVNIRILPDAFLIAAERFVLRKRRKQSV